jgi:1,4-dihydroxy-2-naphthoyl-CoA synthase
MNYQQIDYTQEGPVTIITFDRPEVKNCIGTRTHRELIHPRRGPGKNARNRAQRVGISAGLIRSREPQAL